MTDEEGKYVQPERGPLGKIYEWFRVRLSRDDGKDEPTDTDQKYVQAPRGPLGVAIEKIRVLLFE